MALEPDVVKEVVELIYRSCISLDKGNFAQWLDLCAPEFRYTITTYSPEIRKQMVWLEHDREGMEDLFKMLPKHNSDHSPLTRHASVYLVEYDEAEKRGVGGHLAGYLQNATGRRCYGTLRRREVLRHDQPGGRRSPSDQPQRKAGHAGTRDRLAHALLIS